MDSDDKERAERFKKWAQSPEAREQVGRFVKSVKPSQWREFAEVLDLLRQYLEQTRDDPRALAERFDDWTHEVVQRSGGSIHLSEVWTLPLHEVLAHAAAGRRVREQDMQRLAELLAQSKPAAAPEGEHKPVSKNARDLLDWIGKFVKANKGCWPTYDVASLQAHIKRPTIAKLSRELRAAGYGAEMPPKWGTKGNQKGH